MNVNGRTRLSGSEVKEMTEKDWEELMEELDRPEKQPSDSKAFEQFLVK